MDFLYSISTASLVLRVMHRLIHSQIPLDLVTVLHNKDHWIVRVKSPAQIAEQEQRNFEAFLAEVGVPSQINLRIQVVLDSLEAGLSAPDTMQRYQVVVVSHGRPSLEEVQAFQQSFVLGIGYCPPALA